MSFFIHVGSYAPTLIADQRIFRAIYL